MNIPPPPRVVRWLIQVIWLPMVALLSALLAVFFVIAVLLWPIDRKFRTARVIALVLAFLWIDAGLITGCFYIWLKWIVKGNFRERGPQWRLEHEELLLDALNGIMEHAHKWVGLRVEFEEPMDFGLEEAPLLAFPRHAGPGDSIVLAWMLAALAGRMPRVVLKDFLLWDPGIGCVLGRMESYFVPSRSGAGDDRTQPLLDMAASLDRIDAVLLFPGGAELDALSLAQADRAAAGSRRQRARRPGSVLAVCDAPAAARGAARHVRATGCGRHRHRDDGSGVARLALADLQGDPAAGRPDAPALVDLHPVGAADRPRGDRGLAR